MKLRRIILAGLIAPMATLATPAAALRATPGVVLNPQGSFLNDLSIRGSTFDGAGMALGGLTLRNPQTGHFHAELPLTAWMLSRPAVRTGLGNQGGHSVGTVHLDLLPIIGKKQFEAGFGTSRSEWQNLLVQQMLTDSLGIGVFAGRESGDGLDYPDNETDRETIGGHLQYKQDGTQVDLLIAHQEKEFGARGYYGVSDRLAATEATEDTLLFLSALKGDPAADYLRGGIAWREFHDDYRLPTRGYRSNLRSRVGSVFVDGRTMEINGWTLGGRADLDAERVSGGAAGVYRRQRGGVSILPQWRNDRFKITAGARGEFLSDESTEILPQLGAEYFLSDNLTAFASYTETARQPSYAELYETSPGRLGSPTLKTETARQTEIGLKGIPSEFMDWKLTAFHRRSKNTIDWVRPSSAGRWTATDIGDLNTFGAEAQLGWYPAQNLELQFLYTWLHKDRDAADYGNYASRYALDYPEHLAQAFLLWRPVQSLEVGTVQALRWQTDNPVRTDGDFGADSSFVVCFTPPKAEWATLSLLLNNAWDDDFQALPGQRPPERFAGVSLSVDL